jgi:NO-binding membrane sensor protein with MHYT domain
MTLRLALTTLSVVLAIGSSLMSLWLTFHFRDDPSGRILRKAQSALLMGVGIASMHYTAMAAVSFSSSTALAPSADTNS